MSVLINKSVGRGRTMKKISVIVVLIFAVFFAMMSTVDTVNADESLPTRVINVVYDDSGSMIKNKNKNVDTWCQAKYSMEVFASMLGEKDTMNIYVMSDFDGGKAGNARLSLNGSNGAKKNVAQIHDMVTTAANTPFSTVRKAYTDLTSASADEKWLVVLTDGEFQGVSDINGFFAQKQGNIKVMFLGMGADAVAITPNEANNIFFEKAGNSKDILNKITGISTRIFNSDKLKVSTKKKEISFDVPMRELVVFAQGKDVDIKNIKSSKKKKFKPKETADVKYSTKAATNHQNPKVASDLEGKVAIFKGDFSAGKYKISVKNADTIEVYYKPNIDIAAYLKDSKGKEVTNFKDLEAGEYTISFGFVKKGQKKKVKESDLLGDVKYQAIVTNNGKTHSKTYSSGDKIKLEEGSLKIEAVAKFLEYNTVSTTLDYSIFKDKSIDFKFKENPQYVVESNKISNESEPIKMEATIDGHEFTEKQWEDMQIPEISPAEEPSFELGDFEIKKTKEKGVFNVYPKLADNKPSSGTYEDTKLNIKYDSQVGKEEWSGKASDTLKMKDSRNWFERNRAWIFKGAIALLILLLICGYLPPFKKYLPKKIKKSPSIEGTPTKIGVKPSSSRGSYFKDVVSTLIPYKAETGTIRFVPRDVMGIPSLKVKAAGGGKMTIMNTKAYEGKEEILFDGVSVPEGQVKPLKKGASLRITVVTNGMDYDCMLKR